MINKLWTDEETERMLGMVKEGKTFREIGVELGRNRLSCLGRYHRMMIKQGHVPEPRKWVPGAREPAASRVPSLAASKPENDPGFIFPAIPAPARQSKAVGLLDVTGCKWPMEEDASLIGGYAMCNHTKKDGKPYCAYHCRVAYDGTARPVPKSLGAFGLRFAKAAA